MMPYPSYNIDNFIALMARTSFNNPPAFALRMFSALASNASALTLLTAACADLVVTFCANHGWVWHLTHLAMSYCLE